MQISRRPNTAIPSALKICACCGFDVPDLVEVAHIPNWRTNPDKVVPLCLICHRAYDLGLTFEAEIDQIYANFLKGKPALYEMQTLRALWAERDADWRKLQQGAGKRAGLTRRRKSAARKAARTRAEKQL